jgi:flagellar hook-basal body complex protein FliE
MEPNARLAANAYKTLADLQGDFGNKVGKGISIDDRPDFGGMVSDAVSAFTSQAKNADTQAQAMAAGKADLVDVVTAVSQTQLTMETIVSVRDQVISAYEKIMQMPI